MKFSSIILIFAMAGGFALFAFWSPWESYKARTVASAESIAPAANQKKEEDATDRRYKDVGDGFRQRAKYLNLKEPE